jgi:uncharacterized membrane protein
MDSAKRSIVKSVCYRAVCTVVTFGVAWLVTGKPATALVVGSIDSVTKVAIYYFHERAWSRVQFGRTREPEFHI